MMDVAAQACEAPRISIIIVSYNTREMTLECIDSVIKETHETTYEILLVDNASTDGSVEAVAEKFPDVRLWASEENYGFAGGNNMLAKHARGDYLLLLNPDTIILDGAIDSLVNFAHEQPQAKIWGGRTLYGDHSLNPTNCWDHMSLWSLFCGAFGLVRLFPQSQFFNPEAYGDWARDNEREVGIVTGCFFLIERSFWEELEGFDPLFFMYGEEADLCLRARAAGARPRITPEAEIVHYVGASSNIAVDKRLMVFRAKVSLVRRHFPNWQRCLAEQLLMFWVMSRGYVSRLRDDPTGWYELWTRRAEWREGWVLGEHIR